MAELLKGVLLASGKLSLRTTGPFQNRPGGGVVLRKGVYSLEKKGAHGVRVSRFLRVLKCKAERKAVNLPVITSDNWSKEALLL